jgi:hypothetical protein
MFSPFPLCTGVTCSLTSRKRATSTRRHLTYMPIIDHVPSEFTKAADLSPKAWSRHLAPILIRRTKIIIDLCDDSFYPWKQLLVQLSFPTILQWNSWDRIWRVVYIVLNATACHLIVMIDFTNPSILVNKRWTTGNNTVEVLADVTGVFLGIHLSTAYREPNRLSLIGDSSEFILIPSL